MAKKILGSAAQSLAPGMAVPSGITIQEAAAPFPPDLADKLQKARKGGKYFIAVVCETGENGGIDVHASRVGMNPDFLLRGWHGVARMILDGSLAGVEIPDPKSAKGA
jgi:hypothetical protein